MRGFWNKGRLVARPLARKLAGKQEEEIWKDESDKDDKKLKRMVGIFEEGNSAIISSCVVGLLTGVGVVLFNNGVRLGTFLSFLGIS